MSKKLQDCCSFQEGYVNPSQKDRSFFGGDIKWLRSMDLNNSHIYDTSQHLTNKGFLSAGKSAFMFPKHSIAISKSGTIGELGILEEEMCGNRAVIDIMVDENKADLMYVFYTLKYKKAEIIAKSVGSIQKNLYISELEKISLNHDNIEEQAKISNVLQLIDDKIEINNKINAELESMAKTIYDYWFLQFEFPNEEGKPYKSSGGKMVWNEELRREIPDGWEVSNIDKVSSFENGDRGENYPSGEDFVEKGIPFINGGMICNNSICGEMQYITKEKYKSLRAGKAQKGDILLTLRGSIGKCVYSPFENAAIASALVIIRPQNTINNTYLYHYLISDYYKQLCENYDNGSVQENLSVKIVKTFPIIIPPKDIILKSEKTLKEMDDFIAHNKKENRELASLRDFLLPMLMNGQVGFKDGEK